LAVDRQARHHWWATFLLLGLAARAETRTVDEVLTQIGPYVRLRLARSFAQANVPYPPRRAAFLAFKKEMRLELWADGAAGPRCIRDYVILGASGVPGPKLRRGDLQVPEGIYAATWLNPNSAGYLGIKLDYPNAFDRRMAKADRRKDLGGDIFVHGHWYSTGCLAMGTDVIEDLFVLAADTGLPRLTVIIAPWELRGAPLPRHPPIAWMAELYDGIQRQLKSYR
jgi:hypothetical protein